MIYNIYISSLRISADTEKNMTSGQSLLTVDLHII